MSFLNFWIGRHVLRYTLYVVLRFFDGVFSGLQFYRRMRNYELVSLVRLVSFVELLQRK